MTFVTNISGMMTIVTGRKNLIAPPNFNFQGTHPTNQIKEVKKHTMVSLASLGTSVILSHIAS